MANALSIPDEVWAGDVARFLGPADIVALGLVCRQLRIAVSGRLDAHSATNYPICPCCGPQNPRPTDVALYIGAIRAGHEGCFSATIGTCSKSEEGAAAAVIWCRAEFLDRILSTWSRREIEQWNRGNKTLCEYAAKVVYRNIDELGPVYLPPFVTVIAAYHGHIATILAADKAGCAWNAYAPLIAAYRGNTEMMILNPDMEYNYIALGTATAAAASGGHTGAMLAAISVGWRWSVVTTSRAAAGGHTETMLAAIKAGCSWCHLTTSRAAEFGHTETMLAAANNGCPWDDCTTLEAATGGRTKTLLAAVGAGCPWGRATTSCAAKNGHTETMLAAVAAGCPWCPHTTAAAAQNGHTETMLEAVKNGCGWDPDTTLLAARYRHIDTLIAAKAAGCPWHK